jgi:addiction module RelB/DinJ family antitoxin
MPAQATEEFRVRIDRALVREAKRVADELGTTPGDVVRMLFSQFVKLRALPFHPSEFPALAEYGATLPEADAAEARALKEIRADRKAGKVFRFTAKLP